jgi:hypothetical protein
LTESRARENKMRKVPVALWRNVALKATEFEEKGQNMALKATEDRE